MGASYNIIGVMSGTSLDGLDIVYCKFDFSKGHWKYNILAATIEKYSANWKDRLMIAKQMSTVDFARLNVDYGHFIGKCIKRFIRKNKINVDFIASHGQTIFHQPNDGFTVQIGSGAAIAAETGKTVISDFRTLDVALGGQGAPLVPIGDELLFGDYGCCLNIGGFANLSYKQVDKRIAYDVCPANTILNHLSQQSGKEYDIDGKMAEKGIISKELLYELNHLSYYGQKPPKSLGMEWLPHIFVLLDKFNYINIADQLRTLTEHIALQIARAIKQSGSKTTLSTGGGTHNKFLVQRINDHLGYSLVIPSREIIDYKEALIFAFLGVLRMRNEVNCLCSVTGASRDCCGGAIYEGKGLRE
jgi:anhydro-N-acetylmuramic acid kinase